jgi:hypothetical protein
MRQHGLPRTTIHLELRHRRGARAEHRIRRGARRVTR